MVVFIHNQYVTITVNSNTTGPIVMEQSLRNSLPDVLIFSLSTWTEDEDAVSIKLSHYDLFSLVALTAKPHGLSRLSTVLIGDLLQ